MAAGICFTASSDLAGSFLSYGMISFFPISILFPSIYVNDHAVWSTHWCVVLIIENIPSSLVCSLQTKADNTYKNLPDKMRRYASKLFPYGQIRMLIFLRRIFIWRALRLFNYSKTSLQKRCYICNSHKNRILLIRLRAISDNPILLFPLSGKMHSDSRSPWVRSISSRPKGGVSWSMLPKGTGACLQKEMLEGGTCSSPKRKMSQASKSLTHLYPCKRCYHWWNTYLSLFIR